MKNNEENYTECPKCERRIKVEEKECPYCQYDLVNRPKIKKQENELLIKFKNFIHTKAFIIESILLVMIVVMSIVFIGTKDEKATIEKQYNELQAKLEDTSKTLQGQIKEKDNKITELQQEEKKNEINESIKSLESEKQTLEKDKKTLEQEKQSLSTQIEELKKTSSTITQNKAASTTPTSNPTTTSSTTAVKNTNSAIVYVTKTGNKYHKSNCSYLKKSKIQTTLSEAQSQGYTPCSRCY